MAAPFLIGLIGKQIKGKGLSFLTDLLLGQKDQVQAALPPSLGGLLGFSDIVQNFTVPLTGTADSANDAISITANGATKLAENTPSKVDPALSRMSPTRIGWIIWAIPLIIIGALFFWGINSGWFGGAVEDNIGDATDQLSNVTDKIDAPVVNMATSGAEEVGDKSNHSMGDINDVAKTVFSTVDEVSKSSLDKITFTPNSAGDQLMQYINSGFIGACKLTFRKLAFESGSAKIKDESALELDNFALIMKTYPKVNITISGYTDNQGDADANKSLSEARALSVRTRLIDKGIKENRIKTQGFGAANPVANNDTPEGKEQNRRIEVTIGK
jgi:outer membrane protein OmpA-like peptidoglycan-associated protein